MVTDQSATLINHILTNSPRHQGHSPNSTYLQSQSVGRLDDPIYRTRKAYLPNCHKHNKRTEIFGRSMKKYSTGKFLENLGKIVFPNCLTYTCVNADSAKRIRVKANSEPWLDKQIMSAIQSWDKLEIK